jgi:hypothetical protein
MVLMVTTRSQIFVLLVSCFLAGSSLAESTFLPVRTTPYDPQMSRIRPVLECSLGKSKRNLSLNLVNHWMGDLRAIPYGFSRVWKTPEEVETSPIADCKGKAVALYEKMRLAGANNLRLVIGKRAVTSRLTHTWVEWTTSSGTYVLDPTINWMACRADRIGSRAYTPFYAYSGDQRYRAISSTLVARN